MTDGGASTSGLALPDLTEFDGSDWPAYEEATYAIFKQDLVVNRCYFRGQPVNIQVEPRFKGKEEGFWHVTTETGPSRERDDRVPDLGRCARVAWIRPILTAADAEIRVWGQARGGYSHLGVALPDFSFVIFLRQWPNAVQLKTAYCVDAAYKRTRYRNEWEADKR